MGRMTRALSLAVLLLGSAVPVAGQDAQDVPDEDRFALSTNCSRLQLLVVVEGRGEEEAESAELEEDLRTMAESRLRAARLDSPSFTMRSLRRLAFRTLPLLTVNVNLSSPVFMYQVALWKWLNDESTRGQAVTWDNRAVGTYSNDTGYIVQSVSEALDGFILEYLHVNEAAC